MMGEEPPAFDLLYWNSDATGLPGKVAVQYLRYLCQQDQFATTVITLFGEVLYLSDVTVPVFAIGCETDHIAAWPDSYRGVQQMRSRSKTFVLAKSGHIGGIINPPSKINTANIQILICVCRLLIGRAVLHFIQDRGGRSGKLGCALDQASGYWQNCLDPDASHRFVRPPTLMCASCLSWSHNLNCRSAEITHNTAVQHTYSTKKGRQSVCPHFRMGILK
jgi:hypothetical protein